MINYPVTDCDPKTSAWNLNNKVSGGLLYNLNMVKKYCFDIRADYFLKVSTLTSQIIFPDKWYTALNNIWCLK